MSFNGTKLRLLRRIRRPLQETYWRLFQRRFYAGWCEQRRVRALPLPEIRQLQWRRLKELLQYAYENTDFYQQYFASVHLTPADIQRPENLLQLPVTDERTYRTYFQQIVPRHVRHADLIPSNTAGSTGQPFRFYLDGVTEAANTAAAFALNKEAMGIVPWDRIHELVLKVEPKNRIDLTGGTYRRPGPSPKGFWLRSTSVSARMISRRPISARSPRSSNAGTCAPSMAMPLPSFPWRAICPTAGVPPRCAMP